MFEKILNCIVLFLLGCFVIISTINNNVVTEKLKQQETQINSLWENVYDLQNQYSVIVDKIYSE